VIDDCGKWKMGEHEVATSYYYIVMFFSLCDSPRNGL
jgi:hypothetical protein